MNDFKVLNEPDHVCLLPDPAHFVRGTAIQCLRPRTGGWADGKCHRQYERTATFWRGTPRWADYDHAW